MCIIYFYELLIIHVVKSINVIITVQNDDFILTHGFNFQLLCNFFRVSFKFTVYRFFLMIVYYFLYRISCTRGNVTYVIDVAIYKSHVGPLLLGYKTCILCMYKYRMYIPGCTLFLYAHAYEKTINIYIVAPESGASGGPVIRFPRALLYHSITMHTETSKDREAAAPAAGCSLESVK